jgi:hypothetical protein
MFPVTKMTRLWKSGMEVVKTIVESELEVVVRRVLVFSGRVLLLEHGCGQYCRGEVRGDKKQMRGEIVLMDYTDLGGKKWMMSWTVMIVQYS